MLRSALCLKLLTYSPSAASSRGDRRGLPEAVPGNRNFDYRFTWIARRRLHGDGLRDARLRREASEFLRFLRERDDTYGRDTRLHVRRRCDTIPPEEALTHLSGWNGIGPVLIGNAAEGPGPARHLRRVAARPLRLPRSGGLRPAREGPRPPAEGARQPHRPGDPPPARRRQRHLGIAHRAAPAAPHQARRMLWVALTDAARIGRHIRGVPEDKIAAWEQAGRRDPRRVYWRRAGARSAAPSRAPTDRTISMPPCCARLPVRGHRPLRPTAPALHPGGGRAETRRRRPDLPLPERRRVRGRRGRLHALRLLAGRLPRLDGRTGEAKAAFERLVARGNDVGLFAERSIPPATGEQRGKTPRGLLPHGAHQRRPAARCVHREVRPARRRRGRTGAARGRIGPSSTGRDPLSE